MATLPTGEQYRIHFGDQSAIITEQGATLRSYRVGDRDVVLPFGEADSPQGCQGQHLLPWPNRIRDGRWDLDGVTHQLPLTEVPRHNAIHGLVSWLPWRLTTHTDSRGGPEGAGPTSAGRSIEQRVTVFPQPGWPGVIECQVRHTLDARGLTVEVAVTNLGTVAVPVGYAAHPYLALDAPIDQWRVTAPFDQYLVVDDRLLPRHLAPVDGTPADLRAVQSFGDRRLDTAFRHVGGPWSVTVSASGHEVELWTDEGLGWMQVYTPDDRASLAVEPMSCGPDAFNGGETARGLTRLEPDSSVSWRWGLTAR